MQQSTSLWLSESNGALVLGRVVRALTSLAAVVAILLVLALLVRVKPLPHPHWLVAAGIPILLIGQAWGMAALLAFKAATRGRWSRDPRRFMFLGLPAWQANVVTAIFFLAVLSAATAAFVLMPAGGPRSPTRHCRYPLSDHGYITCVSHERYVTVGTAEQRFAASVFAGFFVAQAGISAAALARRRANRLDVDLEPKPA
jgi:hypothetical protein